MYINDVCKAILFTYARLTIDGKNLNPIVKLSTMILQSGPVNSNSHLKSNFCKFYNTV